MFQTDVNSYYMFNILSLWISNILNSCNNWYATSYYLFNLGFKDHWVLIIVASHLPKYWQQLINFQILCDMLRMVVNLFKIHQELNFFSMSLFFQLYHPNFSCFHFESSVTSHQGVISTWMCMLIAFHLSFVGCQILSWCKTSWKR